MATDSLPKMPYNGSDHNHPAIIMRPDGRIVTFCTGHDGGEVTEYISKNPEDISSGWDGPYYPGGNGGYCYCNAVFLKNEGTKGRLYIFYRDNTQYAGETTNYCPAFCTSDDWGVTWSGKTRLVHLCRQRVQTVSQVCIRRAFGNIHIHRIPEPGRSRTRQARLFHEIPVTGLFTPSITGCSPPWQRCRLSTHSSTPFSTPIPTAPGSATPAATSPSTPTTIR